MWRTQAFKDADCSELLRNWPGLGPRVKSLWSLTLVSVSGGKIGLLAVMCPWVALQMKELHDANVIALHFLFTILKTSVIFYADEALRSVKVKALH